MSARRAPVQRNGADENYENYETLRRTAPTGRIVYRAILTEGREELERSSAALFWSGLAAGLSMGFSMITMGLLKAHLPDAPWQPLITNFGYSVGFLIVILGRQQLFTENTLTPVLPLLIEPSRSAFFNLMRLWGVVLGANLIGAFIVGTVAVRTVAFEPEFRQAFLEIGHAAYFGQFWVTLLRAVFAGWLIALMVWLLPTAETGRIWVIILITYVVALGEFSHIIAGSVEVFALAAAGAEPWVDVLGFYILPTLIGNVVGGVMLVAALNHAQVVSGALQQDL